MVYPARSEASNSWAALAVSSQLARKLLELGQNYGRSTPDGVRIPMPLTQSHLASLIGATRESANKCLRDFRQRGWIQMRPGQILILDPDALRAQVTAS